MYKLSRKSDGLQQKRNALRKNLKKSEKSCEKCLTRFFKYDILVKLDRRKVVSTELLFGLRRLKIE